VPVASFARWWRAFAQQGAQALQRLQRQPRAAALWDASTPTTAASCSCNLTTCARNVAFSARSRAFPATVILRARVYVFT
jgi:hypothetical protein